MTNHSTALDRTTTVLKKLATNRDFSGYRPDGTWLTVKQVEWLRNTARGESAWHYGGTSGHGAGCGGWFDDGENIVHVDVIISPRNGTGFMNIRIENKAAREAAKQAEADREDAQRDLFGNRPEWAQEYPDLWDAAIRNSPFCKFQQWKREFKGC